MIARRAVYHCASLQLLALLGVAGLLIPVFITRQTEEVAHVGDYKIQTEEDHPHTIPPEAAGGVLFLGLVLVGAGLYRRQ